ncbi:hypothetical protein [Aestuariibacter sp. A3R04]|uniref:hypothetical protein n=1 Tax=Aestuariibacter sp. A3R04 TaxID=2841571 RepID=UPI001C080DDD|nr:hypothetical protein [Aestuariibacter sp. A3R04]MBU3021083.1 hypothetical protein [Aestuariibacter sp. A3R04]
MQAINEQLRETLQVLYRKAIDADATLDALQQAQKGKFQSVFADDSGFTTQAKRFSPYVEEIAQDWQELKDTDDETFKAGLAPLIRKIELALKTLNQFQSVGKN